MYEFMAFRFEVTIYHARSYFSLHAGSTPSVSSTTLDFSPTQGICTLDSPQDIGSPSLFSLSDKPPTRSHQTIFGLRIFFEGSLPSPTYYCWVAREARGSCSGRSWTISLWIMQGTQAGCLDNSDLPHLAWYRLVSNIHYFYVPWLSANLHTRSLFCAIGSGVRLPACVHSGLTTAHQNASALREPSRTRSLNRRRVSYGSQLSGSLQAGAPDTRAYATCVRTGGSSSSCFGIEGGALQGNKDEHGLKFLGSLSDVFGDEMVEVRLGACRLWLIQPSVATHKTHRL